MVLAIQFKRGNEADLVAGDLLPAEPAFCLDTQRIMIGDGEGGAMGIPKTGKTLWTGTWNTGAITVTDLTNYYIYIMHTSGNHILIGMRDGESKFRAVGGHSPSGGSLADQEVSTLSATISGNQLTWINGKVIKHPINGSHAPVNMSITAIIGII